MAGHELRCRIPEGLWRALEQRSAETGEPVRHLVATALAELLDVDHQTIFQVSTVGALVEGVYEGAVRIGTLREHGDFGLGTFEGLDGEMVALDGDFFRVRGDGALHPVDDDVLSPYAMVTHFVRGPRHRRCRRAPASTSSARRSTSLRDSENHFFAFRIDGTFPTLHVRAACKVPEGMPLVEAAERQREWNLEGVRGDARRVLVAQLRGALRRSRLPLPRRRRRPASRWARPRAATTGELAVGVQRLEQLDRRAARDRRLPHGRPPSRPSPTHDLAERDHS